MTLRLRGLVWFYRITGSIYKCWWFNIGAMIRIWIRHAKMHREVCDQNGQIPPVYHRYRYITSFVNLSFTSVFTSTCRKREKLHLKYPRFERISRWYSANNKSTLKRIERLRELLIGDPTHKINWTSFCHFLFLIVWLFICIKKFNLNTHPQGTTRKLLKTFHLFYPEKNMNYENDVFDENYANLLHVFNENNSQLPDKETRKWIIEIHCCRMKAGQNSYPNFHFDVFIDSSYKDKHWKFYP